MAVAQNVSIAVGTAKNVYVFGTFVDITSTGGINGAYLAGTSITLNGNATELYTDARTFRLNGVVSGNAVIRSDSIQFGENAAVGGTLTIYGSKKPQLPASVDQSKVIFHQVSAADQNMFQSTFRQLTGLFGFVGLLSTLLLAVPDHALQRGLYPRQCTVLPAKVWLGGSLGLYCLYSSPHCFNYRHGNAGRDVGGHHHPSRVRYFPVTVANHRGRCAWASSSSLK